MESEGREDAMRAVFVRAVAAPFAGVVRVLVLGSGRWRADGMRSRVERCGEVCAMRCAVQCGAVQAGSAAIRDERSSLCDQAGDHGSRRSRRKRREGRARSAPASEWV